MANIAQTVNVLQAMILTKEAELVKTPTFYVFKMYKAHHDATMLPTNVVSENYELDGKSIPAISTSASKSEDGKIHLTISNLNPNKAVNISCELRGLSKVAFEKGEIITAENVDAFNDFGKAEEVSSKSFRDVTVSGNSLTVNLPSKSIVMLELN
jgi:alpha-N-arabinofuranosidase